MFSEEQSNSAVSCATSLCGHDYLHGTWSLREAVHIRGHSSPTIAYQQEHLWRLHRVQFAHSCPTMIGAETDNEAGTWAEPSTEAYMILEARCLMSEDSEPMLQKL